MGSSVPFGIWRNGERRHRLGYRGRASKSRSREARARRSGGPGGDAALAGTPHLCTPRSTRLALNGVRSDRHVITMTGELCDAFPSRREGVAGLAVIAAGHLIPAAPSLYAGRPASSSWRRRFPRRRYRLGQLARKRRTPSAQASGRFVHRHRLNDNGHHSSRRRPGRGGRLQRRRAARRGEFIYTGMTRSFVMSLASRAPFRGAWTPLMNEYFASSADIHRILGDLPDDADKMLAPTAARRPSRLRGRGWPG